MKCFLVIVLVVVLAQAGCGNSEDPGFIEEEPHVSTGAGGFGSGPTGTGGSQPADHNPSSR